MASFRSGAEVGDVDGAVVGDLQADPGADRGILRNLAPSQGDLERRLPVIHIHDRCVPTPIDLEALQCRGVFENQGLFPGAADRNKKRECQNFGNTLGPVFEYQILRGPIDLRRREGVRAFGGADDDVVGPPPKLDPCAFFPTRRGKGAVDQGMFFCGVIPNGFAAENDHIRGLGIGGRGAIGLRILGEKAGSQRAEERDECQYTQCLDHGFRLGL